MSAVAQSLKSIDDLYQFDVMPTGDALYPAMRELREAHSLVRIQPAFVMSLRAQNVERLVGEETRQLETESKIMQGVYDGPIFDFIAQVLLFSNGDVHRRRRQPIARTFAFKLMDAMRPKAAAVAAELIEERLGKGPFDFLGEFAAQIPARIIADVLGIPRSDLPVFMQWIDHTAQAIGFIDTERRAEIERSLVEFNAYVDGLLADRRANPRGDFLSDYVAETAASGDLTEGEIRAQVVGLILAGSDTTRNSMCMTLNELLRHPDQWAALCADPSALKRAAVDEGLRFQPVVSGIPRVAVKDIDIDGVRIPAGCIVAVSIISALRDPAIYANPDAFDIRRTDQSRWHLAFGAGAHRCVGEALARVELEETLAAIARLAPNTTVLEAPTLEPGAIRKVSRMTVAFA